MSVIDDARLAIDGGAPIRTDPFASWPYFAANEIAAATGVLESGKVNYWTGDEGREFEKEFAEFCGSRHAVALANGTAALELALYALGIGPGDEVITASRTFIASASCIVMRGATPVLVDIDPVSQNITADTIKSKLSARAKAIIAVHLAGWPCDMDPIMNLAQTHGLKVIEDCAQAHGAIYKGRPVGSIGHVGAFSFCQDKIITTGGEGGMLTTNDQTVWQRAWAFKDHGKSFDAVYNCQHPSGYRWLHESFGTNWRLTEMQSAIGRQQLRRVSEWVALRQRHAKILDRRFEEIDALRLTIPPEHVSHAYYKYYAFVRPDKLKPEWNRDRIMEAINAEGIPCFSGTCSEIYLERAFAGLYNQPRLRTAQGLGETSLMFLVHPTLSDSDMEDTASAVAKVFQRASRS